MTYPFPFRPRHAAAPTLRASLLLAALFAPMIAMHSVQASTESVIESVRERNSGAGFVLVTSLRRA